ncbi:FHIP family protein AAEL005291 isoform X2 [Bicyclus anynana]|uniref:FHIP family protein AAEL005291 isoform X2 n=1 Tax=Bicyclus anynana TaxID=110368 RepID=A0ABM3LZ91_BICAN|nr:FHIP family protein AAEL005291 isoform X2 [Bicyclus anynana]
MNNMSWLRSKSLILARQLSRTLDPRHDYEPQACYNSFCKHWQQAHEIILKSQPQQLHDDVLGVVNHLEQLTTLLVLEARAREINCHLSSAACLEYLLSENLLDKLYEWAMCTGKYENAVKNEQLKLFGHLISHYSSQVIAAEPFLRPLLKLLSGFRNQLPSPSLEHQLVSVLNQLCVVLMQNMKFIDLFFLTTHTKNGSQAEFIIGRLLLSSVHREEVAGSVARDAFLLCAKMSARCPPLAHCLLTGNACPILATGLSGLYSLLPRSLGDAVKLVPDDVNRVHKLTLFIDSLEFCNAVAQVAHPLIRKHLLDLLYQGFLVPVMGPALLQSGATEQATAMLYLELLLRCVTPGGLLRVILHFLFTYEYDGIKVMDVLLGRLEGNSQLSLVTLSLMETLIDINCEDVMLELIYKYLLNGNHLMASYRNKLSEPEAYREAASAFLGLSPNCCSRPVEKTREWVDDMALSGRRVLDFKTSDENRQVNGVHNEIAMNNLVHEVNFDYGNPKETLFSNYHAYLCDARFEIVSRTIACANWSYKYDRVPPKIETNNNSTKDPKDIDIVPTREQDSHIDVVPTREQDSLVSLSTSGYGTLKNSDTSDKEPHSLNSLIEVTDGNKEVNQQCDANDSKEHDSLTSIGESSGYDSFLFCRADDAEDEGFAEASFMKSFVKCCDDRDCDEAPVVNWRASADSLISPLLAMVLKKVATILQADVTSACRVSSLVCKLACFPTPLLASLLLCQQFELQPNVPSLFQILSRLKEEIDQLTNGLANSDELVDKARVFLIQREMALVKPRAQTNDDSQTQRPSSPAPRGDESPFRRMESTRRSISSSFSNIFNRKASLSPSQHNALSLQNSAYNSPAQKRPLFTQEAYWNQSITLRSILNAVLLHEWLQELSAICEEQALRLTSEYYENDTYIRTLAL